MVTDITLGAGRTTSPVPAVQFLKANGVEVVLDSFFNTMAIQTVSSIYCLFRILTKIYIEIV